MKRLLSVILSVALCFSVFAFTACAPTQQSGKTLMARAKELSAYYDKVPGSYEQLVNGVPSESPNPDSGASGGAVEDRARMSKAIRLTNSTDQLTPEYRPRPFEPGVTHEDAYFTVQMVDSVVSTAKEWAQDAKNFFNTWSILNEWIGSGESGFRLTYDKRLDRIAKESYSFTAEGDTVYMKTSLSLTDNEKINYTQVYGIKTQNETFVSKDYFVEGEYYYSVGSSIMGKTLMFVDLKSTSRRVYYAISNETTAEKQIAYLEDEYIVSYIDQNFGVNGKEWSEQATKINVYDQNGDIAFRRTGERVHIDLWQLNGWTSLETTGTFDGDYTLTTTKGVYSPNNDLGVSPIFENSDYAVELTQSFSGQYGVADIVVTTFTNDDNFNYQTIVSALGEIGLSFKKNNATIFDTFVKNGYVEGAEIYPCPKADFVMMSQTDLADLCSAMDDNSFSAFLAEREGMTVVPEMDAMQRNTDTSAGYEIVNATVTGGLTVDFNGFSVSSDMDFTIIGNALLQNGANYELVLALYSGENLYDFYSKSVVYQGSNLQSDLSASLNESKMKECASGNYKIVAYLRNAQGVRMSAFLFPKTTTQGEVTKNEITITVNEEQELNIEVTNE